MSGHSFRTIAMLFGFALLTSSSYVMTSAIGVSLFLARVGASSLPLILSLSALVVVLVSSLTYTVIVRASTKRCLFVAWGLLASVSLTLSFSLQRSDHSLYVLGGIYILAEVRGCLNTVFLTTLMTDAFGKGTSKRPYVWVAAGAPIAGIITGLILNYEASSITDIQYLRTIACLDLAVLMVATLLPARPTATTTAHSNAVTLDHSIDHTISVSESPDVSRQKQRRFLSLITLLIVAKTVVLTLISFEWKLTVSEYLHENETAMISYFAAYYAVTDVLILTLQLFIAGKLLDRFGTSIAIVGYPLLLVVVAIFALTSEENLILFGLITVAKGMDVIRRALHDPALASAFSKLSENLRLSGIVLANGIFKPTAEVLTAVALLMLAPILDVNDVTGWWATALFFWMVIAVLACRLNRVMVKR